MTLTPNNDGLPKWFIVKTRPSLEVRAGEEILSLGQTVYVPQYRKEFQHARKKAWTTRYFPLIRGYLFVMASAHWNRVLGCESVAGVLRSTDRGEAVDPIPISDAEIRRIRDKQEAGDFDEMKLHGNAVKIGDQVKIGEGLFTGQRGEVAAISDENIVMWINMFGGATKAKVPVANLLRTG